MHARGDETGDVRHVDEKISADFAGKLAHAFEVDHARIGRGTDSDQRGLELTRGFFELLVIDPLVVGRNAVVGHIVKAAGEIGLVTVREMAAVCEVHREDFVARFEHREIDCGVGLRARVGLDIRVFGAEELLGAVDRELLDDIDMLAATVPATAGIAFGVFVGEDRALCLHHGGRGKVFGSDQLDMVALAFFLGGDRIINRSVALRDAAAGGFANTGVVAATFEAGTEEGIDHRDGGWRIGVLAAQAKDVRVVVLAGDQCLVDRADIGRAHMAVTVGGDAHADARSAAEDAEIEGLVGDIAGDHIGVVGIIDRTIVMGAEIVDLVTDRFEVGNNGVFEVEGAVIGSNGNAKSGVAHGVAGFKTGAGELKIGKFTESDKCDARKRFGACAGTKKSTLRKPKGGSLPMPSD